MQASVAETEKQMQEQYALLLRQSADAGKSVGIKTTVRAHEGDEVFRVS